MKIALCLSGQPRYIDIGYQHLYNNILTKYNVDVFSHIWYDEKLVDTNIEFCIRYNRSHRWEKDSDKKILNFYKPKKYIFEPPKQFSTQQFAGANFELIKPENVLSMYYSIEQANKLKKDYEQENNFIYDLVIRCRTDIVLKNFNMDLNTIDKNKLYCYGLDQYMFEGKAILCNDQFAIGNSKNIDTYSSMYSFLEYYWQTYRPPSMVGERILTTHLYYSKVPVYCCKDSEMYVNIFKG